MDLRRRWATMLADARARAATAPEEGSWVSLTCCLMVFWVVMVMAGYAVDGSAQTRAVLYADTVAAQSARHGAQSISADAITGQTPKIDPSRAAREAETFLAAHDTDLYHITGTCSAEETTVLCDTTVVFRTGFLGIIGISTMTVHGHAEAEGTRVVNGEPR